MDTPCEHLARSHLQVPALTGIGGATVGTVLQILPVLAPCTTVVLQYSWESMGAGFTCRGNVTKSQSNRRRDLTADVNLSLCHNVTKILMIKSHNLRFRINGFDVCLVLLPSHRLPTPTRCGSKGQGSRTQGKELHTGPLENTHSNAHSCLQISLWV